MHDCNNLPPLPCKKPPAPVVNAKSFKSRYYRKNPVSCSNTAVKPLTTANQLCHVECLPGYELIENTLKCKERGDRLTYSWAQLVGAAKCDPVDCGPPPDTPHTRHPTQHVVFPNKATWTCQLGYEMVVNKEKFRLDDDGYCKEDAKFDKTPGCTPVPCGECPTGEKKYPHAFPREAGIRTYSESCTYDCDKGYTLDRQAQGQKVFSIMCMATREFSEPRVCKPVLCGPPRDHPHAKIIRPDAEEARVFLETVTYECKEG
jgi:CUB/sushi domain-containing protein